MERKSIGPLTRRVGDGDLRIGESMTAQMIRAIDELERIVRESGLDPPDAGRLLAAFGELAERLVREER